MTIQEAILVRHSVRQYQTKPIETEKRVRLQEEIDVLNSAFDLHIQLVTDEPKAFAGGLAKYGKFSGVNNYLVMAAKKGAATDEITGYAGEHLVLVAQTLGLNTCWVGLTYKNMREAYSLQQDEEVKAVIAIGYGLTQGTAHPQKKGIEHYMRVSGQIPQWFRNGMEAVLLAPTAVNQQKFCFTLSADNNVRAETRFSLVGYARLDLGIAKYHFEVGAGKQNFTWEV